jgi:uncharacterized protein
MGERNEAYAQGVPCWVDLMSSDPEAARAFYAGLFGWDIQVGGEDTGYYSIALLEGRSVAGIGGQPAPEGMPTAWTTYLAVDDLDATAAAFTGAGGSLMMPPMDVMDIGRMAIGVDPTGGAVGLWQAGTHLGAYLVNQPGCVVWNDLNTRALDTASAFFAEVMGYTYDDMGDGGDSRYKIIKVGDRACGGMMEMGAGFPPEVPPHWMTYFAVADTDAAVAKITELGGTLMMGPTDAPFGRFAVVSDPQGGVFTVLAGDNFDD